MGKRKVTILEPAATAVAEIAFFIESKGLTQTAKNSWLKCLNSLRSFQTKELSTGFVLTRFGETCITVALPIRKNMSLLS